VHRDLIYRILPNCRRNKAGFLQSGNKLPAHERRGVRKEEIGKKNTSRKNAGKKKAFFLISKAPQAES